MVPGTLIITLKRVNSGWVTSWEGGSALTSGRGRIKRGRQSRFEAVTVRQYFVLKGKKTWAVKRGLSRPGKVPQVPRDDQMVASYNSVKLGLPRRNSRNIQASPWRLMLAVLLVAAAYLASGPPMPKNRFTCANCGFTQFGGKPLIVTESNIEGIWCYMTAAGRQGIEKLEVGCSICTIERVYKGANGKSEPRTIPACVADGEIKHAEEYAVGRRVTVVQHNEAGDQIWHSVTERFAARYRPCPSSPIRVTSSWAQASSMRQSCRLHGASAQSCWHRMSHGQRPNTRASMMMCIPLAEQNEVPRAAV